MNVQYLDEKISEAFEKHQISTGPTTNKEVQFGWHKKTVTGCNNRSNVGDCGGMCYFDWNITRLQTIIKDNPQDEMMQYARLTQIYITVMTTEKCECNSKNQGLTRKRDNVFFLYK